MALVDVDPDRKWKEDPSPFRRGKFSEAEHRVLEAALKHAVALSDDKASVADLVARKNRKQELKAATVALPTRSIKACHEYVKRHFHPGNYKGVWTAEDEADLRALYTLHGPKWTAIAAELGRERTNVRDKWRELQAGRTTGPWGAEEDLRLLRLIEEALAEAQAAGTPPAESEAAIPWVRVAQALGSRTPKQCRTAWARLKRVPGSQFMRAQELKAMLASLRDSGAKHKSEVVWEQFGRNAHRRFLHAGRSLPGFEGAPFADQVAITCRHYLAHGHGRGGGAEAASLLPAPKKMKAAHKEA